MAGQKREPTSRSTAINVFVGRERELEAITAAFEEACKGRLRVVLLMGDPGIGKTRLAFEASDLFRAEGAAVRWGRCHEEPGTPPYWPWIQALRTHSHETSDDILRVDLGVGFSDIAELLPALRDRFPNEARVPELSDPDHARLRLFDSILTFLRNASARAPLVLIFDNLHWADRPSLLLLGFLAENLGSARVLVMATYRSDALNRTHPLSSTLADLTRSASPVRIRLHGLGSNEVQRFIEFATGVLPPPGLADAVHAHTEGNPLFLGEVVRWLHERGDIRDLARGDGRYVDLGIPDGVREVIGRRLSRLPQDCVEILETASVFGREFGTDLLAQLPSIDDQGELIRHMEAALQARVIEEVRPGQYQFTHALIRETLYEEMSPLRRRKLHGEIGRVMAESSSESTEAPFGAIAHHFAIAAQVGEPQDVDNAIRYSVRAAERAVALLAYEEGVRYYESALDLLAPRRSAGNDQERLNILLALGDARQRAGNVVDSMAAFKESADLAKALGRNDALAAAALGFETSSWWPGMPGGVASRLLEEAIAAVGNDGDLLLRARLQSALARAYIYTGAIDRAREVANSALELARESNDAATVCAAHLPLLSIRWQPNTIEDRMASARESVALAATAGESVLQTESTHWLVYDLMETGDLEEFEAWLAEGTRLCAAIRSIYFVYSSDLVRICSAIWAGRFDEAERGARQALSLGSRMRGHDAFSIYSVQMFTIRREQGLIADLEPALDNFLGTTPGPAVWRPGLAVIYAELGKVDEARRQFETLAKNRFSDFKRDGIWATCMTYLAEVCHFLGDAERAEILYDYLSPFRGHNIIVGANVACLGPADRTLGLLAWAMGRHDEAADHFRAAIAMGERMKAPVWLAHARFDYGRMLMTTAPARGVEAMSLLTSARKIANDIGMRRIVAQVDSLLGPEVRQPGHTEPLGEPLSAREIEVLRLVVTGMSNREIAEALTISANTVANHVKNILAKTGASNRTEATSYAVRHGLVESRR